MAELIAALDVDGIEEASNISSILGGQVAWFKIGSVLFTKCGPAAVDMLKSRGKKVFLDLKFHDIPNTVAGAVANALRLGVDMVNVHASGGVSMMKYAVEAARTISPEAKIIAVTVLTSLDQADFSAVMNNPDYAVSCHVQHLARMARDCGMDGVVCSSHELDMIKSDCGDSFLTVVPGIRPVWESARSDQRRVMTPADAVRRGADYIVIGRPLLAAKDPAEAASKILSEMRDGTIS